MGERDRGGDKSMLIYFENDKGATRLQKGEQSKAVAGESEEKDKKEGQKKGGA